MARGDMNVQVIVWDMKMWNVWNEIGRGGRSGKSGRGNSCQARKAWSPLVASSILCFIPPSALISSVSIFWLKWPLTARIIKKVVSRTLKQSDIVLYAGGDACASIFEDGEAFIQICEKGGDVEWGNALRRKLNRLPQSFLRLSHFSKASAPAVLNTISRRMPDLCPLSLQLNSSDILWDLWHRNFSQILLFKIWCHYEIWAIMVSLWALSQEILMHWMQLLYQSSSIILRARCLARRCTLVNNDHRHLSPTATRGRDNYSFSCGHCNYIVIDIAPTEDTQLSIST